jgi:hypothetical protein
MSQRTFGMGHCEEQSDEATQTLLIELNCSAEPVIGRAFARPVGSQMTSNLTPLPASIR